MGNDFDKDDFISNNEDLFESDFDDVWKYYCIDEECSDKEAVKAKVMEIYHEVMDAMEKSEFDACKVIRDSETAWRKQNSVREFNVKYVPIDRIDLKSDPFDLQRKRSQPKRFTDSGGADKDWSEEAELAKGAEDDVMDTDDVDDVTPRRRTVGRVGSSIGERIGAYFSGMSGGAPNTSDGS